MNNILTRGDSIVRGARCFVETPDTQIILVCVSWCQTGQPLGHFGCLPPRGGRRNIDVMHDWTVDDRRGTEIPVQRNTRLLNIGSTMKCRNIRIWNNNGTGLKPMRTIYFTAIHQVAEKLLLGHRVSVRSFPVCWTNWPLPTAYLYRVAQNKPDYLLLLSKFCIFTTKHVSMIMYV